MSHQDDYNEAYERGLADGRKEGWAKAEKAVADVRDAALLMQNQRTQDAQDLHDFRCAALQGLLANPHHTSGAKSTAVSANQYAIAMLKRAKETDRGN